MQAPTSRLIKPCAPNLGVRGRAVLLGLLFALEWHFTSNRGSLTLPTSVPWRFWDLGLSKYLASALVLYAALIAASGGERVNDWASRVSAVPIRWRFLFPQIAVITGVSIATQLLHGATNIAWLGVVALLRIALGLAGIALGLGIFFPIRLQMRLLHHTRPTLVLACTIIGLAFAMNQWKAQLWDSAAGITFSTVHSILRPFVPQLTVDAAHRILGTPRFRVRIADTCSGIEGIGLICAFGVAYAWRFRDRFSPTTIAAVLAPCLVLSYVANAVRIAMLMVLGDQGASNVAINLFHSEIGWGIALFVISLLVLMTERYYTLSTSGIE